ncbi:carboxypeptidase B [Galendromus occidentalis]|uniref:Carboxypeptidase B n=1 Tax=Galendromus occidentalis TaxID=34638 RepID=A0AAJ6QPU7_9ACAR|nr:carboxypeptidase B [Galendromus occidentalis]
MQTRIFCLLAVVGSIYALPRIESTPKVLPYEEARAKYGADDLDVVDYGDHHLFVAAVENEHQRKGLEELEQERNELDFWNPVFVSRNVSIRVPPALVDEVEKQLKKFHLSYTLATKNLQSWIQHEKEENRQQNLFLVGSDPARFALNQYHSYDEISAYLDAIASRYSDIATLNTIGSTYEGRQIKGLQIASGGGQKPVIWLDSGIHAREWIAPATSLYIINKLVTGAKTDATVKALLDAYDFHVYPLINPDGYERTWSGDRMWRKNRVRFQGYSCQGVDPNRNFGYAFGGPGTSGDVCSDIYRGPGPFSELESQAVRSGVQSLTGRIKMFQTIHSYSQLIMLPYGAGPRIQSAHYNDQLQVAQAGQRAISAYSGLHYQVGTVTQLLSPAAGGAADWAHEGANIKYAFAIELRDKGRFGFLLPASQIQAVGEEWYRATASMVNEISRKETGRTIFNENSFPRGGTGGSQTPQPPPVPQWPPIWG